MAILSITVVLLLINLSSLSTTTGSVQDGTRGNGMKDLSQPSEKKFGYSNKFPTKQIENIKNIDDYSADGNRFWEEHVLLRKPVVVKSSLTSSNKDYWSSDEMLKKTYLQARLNASDNGNLKLFKDHVTVIKGRQYYTGVGGQRMSFISFIEQYCENAYILTQQVPSYLKDKVFVPQFFLASQFVPEMLDHHLFMAYGQTSSGIHYHISDMIRCSITGNFTITHFPGDLYEKISYIYDPKSAVRINPEQIHHAELSKVEYSESELMPGDCLYLPSNHVYQIRGMGRQIYFDIYFDPSKNDTCNLKQFSINTTYQSLENLHFYGLNSLLHRRQNFRIFFLMYLVPKGEKKDVLSVRYQYLRFLQFWFKKNLYLDDKEHRQMVLIFLDRTLSKLDSNVDGFIDNQEVSHYKKLKSNSYPDGIMEDVWQHLQQVALQSEFLHTSIGSTLANIPSEYNKYLEGLAADKDDMLHKLDTVIQGVNVHDDKEELDIYKLADKDDMLHKLDTPINGVNVHDDKEELDISKLSPLDKSRKKANDEL